MTMLDNVNRALAEIGTRSRLTVVDSSTTEGLYAGLLYPMLRDAMLRMGDYDWAMRQESLVPVTPPIPPFSSWNFGYGYPISCARVRQMVPVITDPFDPVPVEWNKYYYEIPNVTVIVSKVPLESAIYTRTDVPENQWDPQFTDAFIRYFASSMTMALENRLEASETVLKNAIAFAGLGNMRDD